MPNCVIQVKNNDWSGGAISVSDGTVTKQLQPAQDFRFSSTSAFAIAALDSGRPVSTTIKVEDWSDLGVSALGVLLKQSQSVKLDGAAGGPTITLTPSNDAVAPIPPTFPDANSVGYKAAMGTLVDSTASITTTAAGQIIELRNMLVNHYIRINHPNCIVRKCVIKSGDFYNIKIDPTVVTGTTTIEDNTFDNSVVGAGQGGGTAIMGSRMLVQRNKIVKFENGIALDGSNVDIIGNYIGQLAAAQPGNLHTDGIQIDGGISNVNINGNTIEAPTDGTSAVMVDNLNGPCAAIAVDANKLSGGSYAVYSDGTKSASSMTSISFTNNIFPTPYGQNGAGTISGQGAASVGWSNNRLDTSTGTLIPKP